MNVSNRGVTVVSWNYHHGKRHCVSETVKRLHESGMLERLITNKYEVYDSCLNRIKPNPILPVVLLGALIRLKNILAKDYKKTFFREWLFDYFASKNLGNPGLVYLDAERFPLVAAVASKRELPTICYQRTAHVDYMSAVLKEEKEKRKYDTGYLDPCLNDRRKRCIENVDFILAHSEFVRDTDIASNINGKNVKVVYGCVDAEIYKPDTAGQVEKGIVLYVGTAPLLKGLFYLLDAWRMVQEDNPGAVLWIVGNKPKDYEERYSDLKGVIFYGYQQDMLSVYQCASLLVQPSLVDAGPKAVTEAMACGLPVVVSNAIGYSEIIENGANGYVVPSRNHVYLADRIVHCLQNPEEMKTMGKKARESVISLNHDTHARHVLDAIESVLDKGAINGQVMSDG
jgi:glycosyltransferase involved in cell wall biosynthesis